MNGKGDKPRKVDRARYDAGYERAFGKRCEVHGPYSTMWCPECYLEVAFEANWASIPVFMDCPTS